jgi:hypothetical protein
MHIVLASWCGRPFVRRSGMAQNATGCLHVLHGDRQIFTLFAHDKFAFVGVLNAFTIT